MSNACNPSGSVGGIPNQHHAVASPVHVLAYAAVDCAAHIWEERIKQMEEHPVVEKVRKFLEIKLAYFLDFLSIIQHFCKEYGSKILHEAEWILKAVVAVKLVSILHAPMAIWDFGKSVFHFHLNKGDRIDLFVNGILGAIGTLNETISEFMTGLKELEVVRVVDVAGVEIATHAMSLIGGVISAVTLLVNGRSLIQSCELDKKIDRILENDQLPIETRRMEVLEQINKLDDSKIEKHFKLDAKKIREKISSADPSSLAMTIETLRGRVSQTIINHALATLVSLISVISFTILLLGVAFPPGLTVILSIVAILIMISKRYIEAKADEQFQKRLGLVEEEHLPKTVEKLSHQTASASPTHHIRLPKSPRPSRTVRFSSR